MSRTLQPIHLGLVDILPGCPVYDRRGKTKGKVVGPTKRLCFEGCPGIRLSVKWPDGQITYPCSRGLKRRKDGLLQIM